MLQARRRRSRKDTRRRNTHFWRLFFRCFNWLINYTLCVPSRLVIFFNGFCIRKENQRAHVVNWKKIFLIRFCRLPKRLNLMNLSSHWKRAIDKLTVSKIDCWIVDVRLQIIVLNERKKSYWMGRKLNDYWWSGKIAFLERRRSVLHLWGEFVSDVKAEIWFFST